MDQAWRGRRGAAAEVALFEQQHPKPAPSGVTRHAHAVEAAAENCKIVVRHTQRLERERKEKCLGASLLAGLARGLHGVRRNSADEGRILADRQGFAEQIALDGVAALLSQERKLLGGFHAL